MVRVIDPSPLDHQKETRFVLQPVDGEPGHLHQRRFAAGIPGPVRLVLHVRTREQAEYLARAGERVEPRAVVHEAAVGTGGEPFGDQVAAVQTLAGLAGILRVGRGYRQELHPTAAQRNVHPVAVGEFDELPGDVWARGAVRFGNVGVGLPIPLRGVRVGRRGRGMRQARGGHDAGSQTVLLGLLQQRGQAIVRRGLAVAAQCFRADADHTLPRLPTRDQRRHRARGIGHLGIDVVRFHQRHVGKLLERQKVLLARLPAILAVQNARCGDRRHAHAVADEQDDVARRSAGECRTGNARNDANRGKEDKVLLDALQSTHDRALSSRSARGVQPAHIAGVSVCNSPSGP